MTRARLAVLLHLLLAVSGMPLRAEAPKAEGNPAAAPTAAVAQRPDLGYGDATILGLVEGITEFLPISSTGHLILANRVLALDNEAQALDRDGSPLWLHPPTPASESPGTPFTIKAAADTYTVVIQVGAIAAVALLYRRRIGTVLAGMIGRDRAGLLLLRNLLIAFFPAVVLGLLLDEWIEEHLFSPRTVATSLLVGAVIMFLAERRYRHSARPIGADAGPDLGDLTPLQALLIGVMQCGALSPGMSRSMMTIVGGYLAGLRPARAAEFSFLLGLPTLTGAAVLKSYKTGALAFAALPPGPILWGFVVAAVSAGISVHWLVGFLNRRGLNLFAWYRIVLAVGVLAFFGA